MWLVITEKPIDIQVKQRKYHEGDNRSCNMYPIVLDDYNSPNVWKASVAVKQKIYTSANLVGNPSTGYIPVNDDNPMFPEGAEEPVCFHNVPVKLAREFLHCYPVKRVVSLTSGDGAWILAAMKVRTTVLAVTLSEVHKELLQDFCVHQTFRDFQDPDDPNYDAGLVTAISTHFENIGKASEAIVPEKPVEETASNKDSSKKDGKKDEPQKTKRKAGSADTDPKSSKFKKGSLKRSKRRKKVSSDDDHDTSNAESEWPSSAES